MKIVVKIAIGLLLAISVTATADFQTVERAYEVPMNRFRMPGTTVGALAFKQCEECDIRVLRVTARTQYVFNSESLELPDFRKAFSRINDRAGRTMIVLHHLESDTVSKVTVTL